MSAVRTPALAAEAARYPWWPEAWSEIDEGSREAYDRWVGAVRGGRSARRARLVVRRVWNRRPWAGPVRRRLHAVVDLIDSDRSGMYSDVATGPAGWAP